MIPTYNQAHFISRAIESALGQSYKNIEIIISDDRSSDETPKTVADVIRDKSDPRIFYHRNKDNLGILRNYHDTLLKTTGDLIINLDGDDFFVNSKFFEQAVALFRKDIDIALVFGNYCEYSEVTQERLDICNKSLPQIMSDRFFYSAFAANKITWNHNTIVYKRHTAVELGFYWDPIVPRNDWESFLRLIAGHKVGYLPDIQAAWVQHGRNETRRLDINKYLNNYALVDEVTYHAKDYFEKSYLDKWRKKMFLLNTRNSTASYLINRDIKGLASFLFAASKVDSGLPLRALASPSIVFRAAISLNPKLYKTVKAAFWKAKSIKNQRPQDNHD